MPVRRFRSADEMEELAWLPQGSPELWRAIRSAWGRARAMAPWRVAPGVHRYRNMTEANAQREEWERTCVQPAARRIDADDDTGTAATCADADPAGVHDDVAPTP